MFCCCGYFDTPRAGELDTPRAGELDTLLFSSLDAGATTFLTAGAKIGLPTLKGDGAVALMSLGVGRQRERGPDGRHERYTALGAITVGYQWLFEWGVAAVFAGSELTTQMLADRTGSILMPARLGFRLHGEIWARPTEKTLVQGTVIAGTARDSVWARIAWGLRLWGPYIGPEASLYTDASGFKKVAFGLHATDFALGDYSFRIAAGLQHETDRRSLAPYLAFCVWSPW